MCTLLEESSVIDKNGTIKEEMLEFLTDSPVVGLHYITVGKNYRFLPFGSIHSIITNKVVTTSSYRLWYKDTMWNDVH